jgi:S-formylglutathione hydrolase FrmB
VEPNSALLVVVLFAVAIGALVVLVRFTNIFLRVGAGVVALALATTGGMAVVNDYYGYYQTWSQLSADLSGSYAQFTSTALGDRSDPMMTGKVVPVSLPGARSGINRTGYVYLPPEYFQPAYAHTHFPVVELLHGTPGYAASWLVHMHTDALANQLISHRLMGPMVLVMPATYTAHTYQECLNSGRGQDDTYLTYDVRHDVEARFRVATTPAEWAVSGISSGGYCAANLALRHPAMWGASGIISGYFRPEDGPAANVLDHDVAAEDANDPLLLARSLTARSAPLPSFWLSAGLNDPADIAGARAFATALHGIERVTLFRDPGSHDFYSFGPAFARVLPWAWTQIAPPALRVRFPIAGGVTSRSITVHATRALPKAVRCGQAGSRGYQIPAWALRHKAACSVAAPGQAHNHRPEVVHRVERPLVKH